MLKEGLTRCTVSRDRLVSRGTREKRNVFFIDGEIDRLPLNSAMSANRKRAGGAESEPRDGRPRSTLLDYEAIFSKVPEGGWECDGSEMEWY